MSDGRRIVADQTVPTSPDERHLRRMVENKFAESGQQRLSAVGTTASLEMLGSLERCQDLRSLTRLLQ